MRGIIPRSRPPAWPEYRARLHRPLPLLLVRVEWWLSWAAWALSNWAFLDVLEHLGTFSVLIGLVLYFSETGNRIKQKHYQAWQVINTAQGKGGNGGRIEALQELNSDHVPLVGVDAGQAFLQGITLRNARLSRCNLHATDLRNSDFADATLAFCNLEDANLRESNLTHASLENADLAGADLSGADLSRARLANADLSTADLREADLNQVEWREIRSLHLANLAGARNSPAGLLDYARTQGAVFLPSDQEWQALLDQEQKPAK